MDPERHEDASDSQQKLILHQQNNCETFPNYNQKFAKMLVFLRLSVVLLFVIISLQIAIGAGSGLLKRLERDMPYEISDFDESHIPFSAKVGLYLKNYAGRTISTAGESVGDFSTVLTMPKLRIEDHIWDGKSVTLECWSETHPVVWEYRGLGDPQGKVRTERRANSTGNSNTSYGAVITFSSTNYRQTGEYSCRPAEDSGDAVVIFIFSPGKKIFVGEDSTVYAEDNGWATIPCPVSNKDANVDLSISGRPLKNVTFDPAEGFRVKWKGIGAVPRPWGMYSCVSSQKGVEERQNIKLRPSGSSANRNRQGGAVNLSFNQKERRIECCSNSKGVFPKMIMSPCVGIGDCVFASSIQNGMVRVEKKEEEMSFLKRVGDSCLSYELPEDIGENGAVRCASKDKDQKNMHFSWNPGKGLVTDFDLSNVATENILVLGRERETDRKETTFFCRPHSFYFSDGIKWALQLKGKGQELKFLPEENSRSFIRVDEKSVVKVYCFAPVWNSAEWRNISMSVPS